MPEQLDQGIYEQITALCKAGDSFATQGKFSEAMSNYDKAWLLLPDPKEQWEAAVWIQSALGDAYFFAKDYERALIAFSTAVQCPGGLGNPFVHLRLGECQFELGHISKAQDELTRAYIGGGRKLFANEDPKYLNSLRGVLAPPPGQEDL